MSSTNGRAMGGQDLTEKARDAKPAHSARYRRLVKALLPRTIRDLIFAVRLHRRTHGTFPRLIRPRTFNELILRRKVFDRRPILTTFVDKLAVRNYVASKVGHQFLPKLHCVFTAPEQVQFDALPSRFVIKATHGSGWVRIVMDRSVIDERELSSCCARWLSSNYYDVLRERQYRPVPPGVMVEEFIDDGSGQVPRDYKFSVFNGRVCFIQVDVDRFGEHRQAVYDREWQDTGVRLTYERVTTPVRKPDSLALMIGIAEKLSDGLDFVRVDLYEAGGRVYFGEMTPTPASGLTRFKPKSMDDRLGSLWRMSGQPN